MITRKELIKKYIEFFKSKGHKEIPNSSLIPENDPTVLFTTAGMHPLVPFLLGQKHSQGKRLVNVQRCIRTGDINEVGDTTHHTFFEMLGNWSLGDYFKKEAIEYSFEFLTKVLKIQKEKLAVTIFAGESKMAPADFEAKEIWRNLGIPENKIEPLGKEGNWWGPAGDTGLCGPDTEMFYWRSKKPVPEKLNPNYSTLATEGRKWEEEKQKWGEEDSNWVEIWNDVLMQYNKDKKGNYNEAKQKNIDTGMGVERTVTILNGLEDNYLADMWQPLIKQIEKLSGKKYTFAKGDLGFKEMPECWIDDMRLMRIIADHIKAAVFIIADGVVPSNTEQGYVLRRLIRKAVRYAKKLGIPKDSDLITPLVKEILKIYSDYNILKDNKQRIIDEINKEEDKFELTLEKGIRKIKKMSHEINVNEEISGKKAFLLYQSYGFPIEMTREIALESGVDVDIKSFNKELKAHQSLSRTSSAGKFKSGLADNSEQTAKLHTATHLLNQALREVLKDPKIYQRGSNITPERLRFDFNFDRKLADQEKKKIEDWVNDKIKKDHPVKCEEMPVDEAKKKGAQGIFDDKYKDKVKVYSIGKEGKEVSKEICAGPHVDSLGELGKFKIKKEESSSSGVRRIKGVLE